MELADRADRLKREGHFGAARELLLQSFELERTAALKLRDKYTVEPTRSVLSRSAASLALECGLLREAEQMISIGLSGEPPEEIAEELRDLVEKVHFTRHLALRGIELSPDEFQLTLWGRGVGFGVIEPSEVMDRIEKMERLSIRTLERKFGKPFRESGRPAKEISQSIGFFMSAPRAASFAVTLRMGRPQAEIPGASLGQDVVKEIMDCLDLASKGDREGLQERIPDPAYFENFERLTSQLLPDGQNVEHVGLTSLSDGKERKVVLERKKPPLGPLRPETAEEEDTEASVIHLEGNLRYADSTKKRHGLIELVEQSGKIHKIQVPLSIMADIVRPMYELDVVVKAKYRGRSLVLEDIEKADS